ncbi:Synaptotagmin-C [Nymphon striatum]|nr:Synaptotagmin-C [Nymphon striatum]
MALPFQFEPEFTEDELEDEENNRYELYQIGEVFRKSCVHKNTVNPQFNEDFIFDVPPEQLTSCILQIILFDYNEYSRHECMGFVELPLEHIDLSEKVTLWKGLSPYDCQPEACGGELMISLCYLPSAQRLTVAVMKARNIGVKQAEDKSSIDCYVKVTLNQNGKKIKKKKTSVQKGVTDFVFNEALTFDISNDILKSMNIVLSLVSDNIIGQNELLGRILIGTSSKDESCIGHYKELLLSKSSAIAMWHQLSLPR